MDKLHEHWMKYWGYPTRSKHILVFHGTKNLTAYQGKGFKSWRKIIQGRGYQTHTWYIRAPKCGAFIWSHYIATFCYPNMTDNQLPTFLDTNESLRPCQNIIRTYGIPHSECYPVSRMTPCTHPIHPNLIGTLFKQPVYNWDGPFCGINKKGWILVPKHGIRRLQFDELAKLKGLTNSKYTNTSFSVLLSSI